MLAFIVPARDEAAGITQTLESIQRAAGELPHEVIVVDNGSEDDTVTLTEAAGARCLSAPDATVAGLRNLGAAETSADVLIFLDADVRLDSDYDIRGVVEAVQADPRLVTGSRCVGREAPAWVERTWLEMITKAERPRYINSGHLIVHRRLFEAIGGFDGRLETGEDYDICRRAVEVGARILDDPALVARHDGYPQTLSAFFKRERWHGRGDAGSLSAIASSKPAVLGLLQLCIVASAGLSAMALGKFWLLMLGLLALVAVSALPVLWKCRRALILYTLGISLYAVYFAARGVSVFDVMLGNARHAVAGRLARQRARRTDAVFPLRR